MRKIRKPNFYLFFILLFIYGDVVCENYVFRTYNSLSQNVEFFLFVGTLLLMALAAPIQAAFSDLYCRKKSLVFSLSCSLISMILLLFFNLKLLAFLPIILLLSFIKGAFGNTIPLSLAAIADTQNKNYRFSFGVATLAYAIAYLMLIFATLYIEETTSNIIIIIYYSGIIYISIRHFKDIRDKEAQHNYNIKPSSITKLIKHELMLVINDLKKGFLQYAIITFFLWEVSVYCILLLYVDFNVEEFRLISISMMLGYLIGILILKIFGKIPDHKMARIGYLLGALSLLPFYIHSLLHHQDAGFPVLAGCFVFHSVGMAILPPTLFAMLAKGSKPHEQGRIYGIIESVDTIAFLFSSIAVMVYTFTEVPLLYIVSLSFITVVFSWIPFIRYEKLKPKELLG